MLSVRDYSVSGALVEISRAAYPSTVSSASIRVWISSFAASAYREIDPDRAGSSVRLPEGALIVREVRDDAGTLKKLTLMGKGARGYNAVVGDYWYGVTDPAGTAETENGAPLIGRLEQCFGCHQARGAADDFLFGVPLGARGGGPGPVPPPPPSPPPLPPAPGPVCGDFQCELPETCEACASDCCYVDDDDDDDEADD